MLSLLKSLYIWFSLVVLLWEYSIVSFVIGFFMYMVMILFFFFVFIFNMLMLFFFVILVIFSLFVFFFVIILYDGGFGGKNVNFVVMVDVIVFIYM